MTSLSKMFADKSRLAKQNALRNILNAKMVEGQSGREHMLKMMDKFDVAEILGANIDMQSKVDMILETLPASYNQFKLNYNMNKLNMDLTELMQELQDAQSIMKSKNHVHFAQASTSGLNPKRNNSNGKQKQIKGKRKKKVG